MPGHLKASQVFGCVLDLTWDTLTRHKPAPGSTDRLGGIEVYVNRLSRKEIRWQIFGYISMNVLFALQAVFFWIRYFLEPFRLREFTQLILFMAILATFLLAIFLLQSYRWFAQGRGYRIAIVTNKSLVLKKPGLPFTVIKPSDIAALASGGNELLLHDGNRLSFFRRAHEPTSFDGAPIIPEVLERWWPEITLEKVGAAQREANQISPATWVLAGIVLAVSLNLSLALALITESLVVPGVILALNALCGIGYLIWREWKYPFVYHLPPTNTPTPQIQSVAHDITTANAL